MLKNLFVFDTETVVHLPTAVRLLGSDLSPVEANRAAVTAAVEAYYTEKAGNSFPRQMLWQLVAASFVSAEIEPVRGEHPKFPHEKYHFRGVFTGGDVADDERTLVTKMMVGENGKGGLARNQARLVHFNGNNFDVPVLVYIAMRYGIPMPWFFRSGDGSKWDGYASGKEDWNCDLNEAFRFYGKVRGGVTLHEIATNIRIPGKLGMDGSKVAEAYANGQLPAIRNYCEHDALTTYLTYLHRQHLMGVLLTPDFEKCIMDVVHYLEAERAARPHLGEYLEAWTAACGGNYLPYNV
ncbi:MAG: hypothetical protein WAX89_04095 [Alphaproteobacteria bacterium]